MQMFYITSNFMPYMLAGANEEALFLSIFFNNPQFCPSFVETAGTRFLFAYFALFMLILNVATVLLLDAQ
jgi:hypothetical protein